MSTEFVWIASFFLFPIAGAPLLTHPSYRPLGFLSRFVLSAAAGCVAVSTAMTVSTILGLPWRPALLVLAGGVVAAGARLLLPRETAGTAPHTRRRLQLLEWIAVGVILVCLCSATLAASSASATSPDLFLFWGPKAIAFANARGIDAAYLANPLLRYQHFSYPPLVPNAYAFATLLAGRFPWMAAVMTFPLLLTALVLALPGALRGFCSRRSALVASASIAASLTLIGREYFVAGNADSALMLFEVLAVALLLGRRVGEKASLLLAGLLLGGAASAKVEGLPFALASGLLFLALLARRGGVGLRTATALVLGPTAVVVAIWFGFEKSRLGFLGYESYGPFFEAHWRSFGRVLWTAAQALATAGGGLPWIVPVAALAASVPRAREALVPAVTSFVLAVFFLFTYLHGGDPTLWINWSAGRIFAVISPLLIMASVAEQQLEAPLAVDQNSPCGK